MRSLLVLAGCIAAALAFGSPSAPRVRTQNGIIEGLRVTNYPMKVNAFLSVPFANPPARFAKPLPKSNWTGVLQTKTMPPRCQQVSADPVSEDCLYLNVFAPATGSGYPVVVVVYGGAFATGGARNQGTPEHIAKHIVSKGVVVVVIQYRVGPLGFCTTGDSVMKGNYGMWDATMSLQWIQNNIGAFGGNKNAVTMWGGSAGAGMIEAMHLSPHSTNLFHKMMLFSGGATNMFESPVVQSCIDRAHSIGLTWNTSAQFLAAMTSAPASSLGGGWLTVYESAYENLLGLWSPQFDGDFFPARLAVLRAAAAPKPMITGISFLDGAGLAGAITITHDSLNQIVNFMVPSNIQNGSYIRDFLLDAYRTEAALLEPNAIDKHAMQAAFGDRTIGAAVDAISRRYLELFGEDQIIYRYVFKHFNPAAAGASYPFISYASHSFDQFYFVGPTTFNFTRSDELVRDIVCTAFTNFIKYSNPNGNGASSNLPVPWLPATPAAPSFNYIIDVKPSMDDEFLRGRPFLNNQLNTMADTMTFTV